MIKTDTTKPLTSNEDDCSIENYRHLLDTLDIIPWEFHWPSQRFSYVGPQAAIFGYPIDDWYGEGFLQKLVHPDDIDDVLKQCERSWKNHKNFEGEFRIAQANGEICWVRKIVGLSGGADGCAILRGIFVDISAQKQTEEILISQNNDLRQREFEHRIKNDQFDAAINNMSQGLSMFDSERRLIVCNTRYASMYQLPPELTRSGTTVEDLTTYRIEKGIFPAAEHGEAIRQCMEANRQRKSFSFIHELNNGRCIQTVQVPMASGGWLATHEDITERRRAQEALQKSQEALSIAFRLSPVSMSISDMKTGKHIEINDAWSTMLGYSREEGLANSSLKLGIWPDTTMRKRFIRQIINERTVLGLEARICSKEGRVLDVVLSGELVEIDGKQRLLIACHDITKRKKIEHELIAHRDHLQELVDAATVEVKGKAEELENALSKERELNELQRQFVAMASHEFRTPLAIIDSTAQRLIKLTEKNRLTPENALERYDKIRNTVQRMIRLMESALTAAQIEEGKVNVEIGPCQIGKVINELCSYQQEITKNHVISCELIDLPEVIQADTGALQQVLTNLLSNAEKYAPGAPSIKVKAHTKGDEVVVSVHDEGIGIDEDELDRIGERFFRARTSSGISGTGIGLNLSMKLLEMHGGSLHVKSRKFVGSSFCIHLPIAGPQRPEQPQTQIA